MTCSTHSCRNGCASKWSVATWLVPSANTATDGVCKTKGFVAGVLDWRATSEIKVMWFVRMCLLCPLVGTASGLDGGTDDVVDDDD